MIFWMIILHFFEFLHCQQLGKFTEDKVIQLKCSIELFLFNVFRKLLDYANNWKHKSLCWKLFAKQ